MTSDAQLETALRNEAHALRVTAPPFAAVERRARRRRVKRVGAVVVGVAVAGFVSFVAAGFQHDTYEVVTSTSPAIDEEEASTLAASLLPPGFEIVAVDLQPHAQRDTFDQLFLIDEDWELLIQVGPRVEPGWGLGGMPMTIRNTEGVTVSGSSGVRLDWFESGRAITAAAAAGNVDVVVDLLDSLRVNAEGIAGGFDADARATKLYSDPPFKGDSTYRRFVATDGAQIFDIEVTDGRSYPGYAAVTLNGETLAPGVEGWLDRTAGGVHYLAASRDPALQIVVTARDPAAADDLIQTLSLSFLDAATGGLDALAALEPTRHSDALVLGSAHGANYSLRNPATLSIVCDEQVCIDTDVEGVATFQDFERWHLVVLDAAARTLTAYAADEKQTGIGKVSALGDGEAIVIDVAGDVARVCINDSCYARHRRHRDG